MRCQRIGRSSNLLSHTKFLLLGICVMVSTVAFEAIGKSSILLYPANMGISYNGSTGASKPSGVSSILTILAKISINLFREVAEIRRWQT